MTHRLTDIWAVGLLLLGVYIFYLQTDKLLNEIRVWSNGRETQAQIAKIRYRVKQTEDDYEDIYEVEYSFSADSKVFYGRASVDVIPIEIELDMNEEFVPRNPTPILIRYEVSNPSNNYALSSENRSISYVLGSILMAGFGLGFTVVGLRKCKAAIPSLRKHFSA
jgi:hypothetical protein